MSQSPVDHQFDQLADRLRRLSLSERDSESLPQIMSMTLAELENETIKFGKAHCGKTYASMVTEHRYMTWFAETYKDSRQTKHVKFLRFIQLHVENLEKNNQEISATTRPKAKACPKALASTMPIDLESEPEEWDQVPEENTLELLHMQRRMLEIENVMQQVLAHLKGPAGEPQ